MILVTLELAVQMVVNDHVTFTYLLSLKTVCCMMTKHVSGVAVGSGDEICTSRKPCFIELLERYF
jgi:hypothetical protein